MDSEKKGMTPAALQAFVAGDLGNFIAASTPGGIEAQEAAGQKDLVCNDVLPIHIKYGTIDDLKKMGIVFGEPVDDIFISAKLPEGWKKVPDERGSYWSSLQDEKGRERAAIFYKAAFYDRRSHIILQTRFTLTSLMGCDKDGNIVVNSKETHNQVCVLDCKTPFYVAGKYERKIGGNFKEEEILIENCRKWLEEKYPDWENPMAYWD